MESQMYEENFYGNQKHTRNRNVYVNYDKQEYGTIYIWKPKNIKKKLKKYMEAKEVYGKPQIYEEKLYGNQKHKETKRYMKV